jgi:hypothetical protein
MVSDESVPSSAMRPSVANDEPRSSGVPHLEPFLAQVITSLSDDSHNVVSKALKAYDRLVLNASCNILANRQKIEEARREIKNHQLSIERVQWSLIDDVTTILRHRNAEGVPTRPSARDNHEAKRRAIVSSILFHIYFQTVSIYLSHLVHIYPKSFY